MNAAETLAALKQFLQLGPRRPRLAYDLMPTPLGPLLLAARAEGLVLVEFVEGVAGDGRLGPRGRWGFQHEPTNGLLRQTRAELAEYFAGQRRNFTVPLAPLGTDFQQQVWATLQTIPYGQTCSYKEEARRLGRPTAVRAVANANGQNWISILIPCHRVIGSNGQLTGYGGGLDRKQWLLALERGEALPPAPARWAELNAALERERDWP